MVAKGHLEKIAAVRNAAAMLEVEKAVVMDSIGGEGGGEGDD